MKRGIDKLIGAASSVMGAVDWSVVKRELSRKTKLSMYWSIYGHKICVVLKKKMGTRIKSVEISLLNRVSEISLRESLRSSSLATGDSLCGSSI